MAMKNHNGKGTTNPNQEGIENQFDSASNNENTNRNAMKEIRYSEEKTNELHVLMEFINSNANIVGFFSIGVSYNLDNRDDFTVLCSRPSGNEADAMSGILAAKLLSHHDIDSLKCKIDYWTSVLIEIQQIVNSKID